MRKKYLKFLNSILMVTVFSSLSFFAYTENAHVFAISSGATGGGGEVPVKEDELRKETKEIKEKIEEIRFKEVGKSIKGLKIGGVNIPPGTAPTSLDALAWILAKQGALLIAKNITNWAKDGFDGKPLFITDPESYFLDIGDNIAGDFIKSAGFGQLCSPFQLQVQTAIVLDYNSSRTGSRDPYQASCTLSGVVNNVQSFISGDFSQGGWGGWYSLTQGSQNNPYAAFLSAREQLTVRLSLEKGVEITRANWASGFLSTSDCVRREKGEDGKENPDGKCEERGPTKTPGKVVEQQLNGALGTNQRSLEIADEFDEVLTDVVSKLVGKITNVIFGGGLFDGQAVNDSGGISLPSIPGIPQDSLFIALSDPNPLFLTVGDSYDIQIDDPGYIAFDPNDGNITGKVLLSGFVDTSIPGDYFVTYSVTNSSGQTTTATRTITVQNVDTSGIPGVPGIPGDAGVNQPPTITLVGSITQSIVLGSAYDASVCDCTAFDLEDGDITSQVVQTQNPPIDTNTPGLYSVDYNVTDSGGLSAPTQTRIIFIQ